ncbi:MAG TPA: hypothetical protein VMF13_22945, partial [Luteitalea sp.]|nr:hypothetical protein [Luteitalea sp.]
MIAERLMPWGLWLEQSPLGTAVRTSSWMYPAAEVGHLLGLGLLVGSAVAFDLRLLGVASRLPVDGLAAFLLPVARIGFALLGVTGFLLFAANATTLLTSIFAIKLGAIGLGCANASLFHRGVFQHVAAWNLDTTPPPRARLTAMVSLL